MLVARFEWIKFTNKYAHHVWNVIYAPTMMSSTGLGTSIITKAATATAKVTADKPATMSPAEWAHGLLAGAAFASREPGENISARGQMDILALSLPLQ
jgi:hypothetical protein